MLVSALLFCAGIGLLLLCSRLLVQTATSLSQRLGISPLITGMTLVAVGTSLPELVVSLAAVSYGDSGLALSNIIGSNVANVLLILGLAALLGSVRIGTHKTISSTVFLCAITLGFVGAHQLVPIPWGGMVLLLGAGLFTYLQIQEGRKEHLVLLNRLAQLGQKRASLSLELIKAVVAIGGLTAGGVLVVRAVEQLSHAFEISTTFLGLTLTAVATSLPELITTVLSGKNNQEKLALGNIIGSNIYNLLLIGGLLLLVPQPHVLNAFEIVALLISTLFLGLLVWLFKGRPIVPLAAGTALVLYGVYLCMSYVRLA